MSNRAVAAAVFRAWGVMWSINVLVGLAQLLNELLRHNQGWNDKAMENYVLSSQMIALGCEIVVIVFLFRKADWLAGLVFPVEHEVGFSFGAGDLRSVLFSVVGLYFVLDGARRAVGSTYQIFASGPHRNSLEAVGGLWQRDPENLARSLGGIIAGGILLIGPSRLLRFCKRYVGRAPETDELKEPPGEG